MVSDETKMSAGQQQQQQQSSMKEDRIKENASLSDHPKMQPQVQRTQKCELVGFL